MVPDKSGGRKICHVICHVNVTKKKENVLGRNHAATIDFAGEKKDCAGLVNGCSGGIEGMRILGE